LILSSEQQFLKKYGECVERRICFSAEIAFKYFMKCSCKEGCKCNSGSSIIIKISSFDNEARVSKYNKEIIISTPDPKLSILISNEFILFDKKALLKGALPSMKEISIFGIPKFSSFGTALK